MPMRIINHDEAVQYMLSISDAITRQLVSVALRGLELAALRQDPTPIAEFDALFYVKVLEGVLGRHGTLRTILEGGSVLWPEDNDVVE